MTITDVLKKIEDDLNWRGPSDMKLGHVVLERAQAEYLAAWMHRIIIERDQLQFEKEEQLRKDLEQKNERP